MGAVLVLGVTLLYAFWPRATMVDLGEVTRGPMHVAISDEAKTRVREAYVVSAPIAGRLMRVEVEPGDLVTGGETEILHMMPLNPSALDIRTREQARAAVSAAQAAQRAARADLNKATADKDLAAVDLDRMRELRQSGIAAQAALDRAERVWRASRASLDMAQAALAMREADLANARARLIGFGDETLQASPSQEEGRSIPLLAPVTGRILRVMQESETTLAAGAPILEIGDTSNDLEIVAELLSADAVKVSVGNRVIIDKWGGTYSLNGTVERVEPWGFTKFSALGVEEQRVNVIIQFTDPLSRRENLGHGFRVETRVVIWEEADVLIIPSSAIFRHEDGWAAFAVVDGVARFTELEIGQSNGTEAELLGGLEEGARIILYPGPGLDDGTRVAQRQFE